MSLSLLRVTTKVPVRLLRPLAERLTLLSRPGLRAASPGR